MSSETSSPSCNLICKLFQANGAANLNDFFPVQYVPLEQTIRKIPGTEGYSYKQDFYRCKYEDMKEVNPG